MNVTCSVCQTVSDLGHNASLNDAVCESCGSSFDLGAIVSAYKKEAGHELDKIGRFELMKRVGTGSNGTVWRAHDPELQRDVAVKIPLNLSLDENGIEKFMREARAAARLRHGNIVGVHEVGREDDVIYIVTDFIEGKTLAEWLLDRRLTPREAAGMAIKLARALHFAHEEGVIHRDLKPANIMVDDQGELHLMDFGLAKRLEVDPKMTLEGQVLGTPAYMSPEQAGGEAHSADRRTDVYSLGVIFYEMLTGERPFQGKNMAKLLDEIMHRQPAAPGTVQEELPTDLDAICLEALEKSPEARFATAAEFADALEGFLKGESFKRKPELPPPLGSLPSPAKPAPSAKPSSEKGRRRRMISMVSAVAVLLLLVAGGLWHVFGNSGTPIENAKTPEEPVRMVTPVTWNLELRDFIEETVGRGADSHLGRILYSEISEAMSSGEYAEWRIGGGLARGGVAVRITTEGDGRWTSGKLTSHEVGSRELGEQSIQREDVPPKAVLELVQFGQAELRIESFRGKRYLRGRIPCESFADVEVRDLVLVLVRKNDLGDTVRTQENFQYLDQEQLPSGELEVEMEFPDEDEIEEKTGKTESYFQLEAFILMGDPRKRYLTRPLMIDIEKLRDF